MSCLSSLVPETMTSPKVGYDDAQAYRYWSVLDSASLFSVANRRPKGPLAGAASSCLNRMTTVCNRGTIVSPADVISIYNNAALIFYHNGQLNRARELTLEALRLCQTEWEKKGDTAWASSMLQSYVNLGRLAFARGEFTDAYSYYANVYDYVWTGKPLVIGTTCLGPDLLSCFQSQRNEDLDLGPFAVAVCLANGGTALLAAGDPDGTLELVLRLADDLEISELEGSKVVLSSMSQSTTVLPLRAEQKSAALLMMLELQARAFTMRGEVERALALYASMAKRLPRLRPAMIGMYSAAAELLLRKKMRTEALSLIQYAQRILVTFAPGPNLELEYYQAYFTLALQYARLGDKENAQCCATKASTFATTCCHEVGTLRAAVVLLLTRAGDRVGVHEDHELSGCLTLVQQCMYPLERASALLELSSGLRDHASERSCWAKGGYQLLMEFQANGGHIPDGLATESEYSGSGVKKSPLADMFVSHDLTELYERLKEYKTP